MLHRVDWVSVSRLFEGPPLTCREIPNGAASRVTESSHLKCFQNPRACESVTHSNFARFSSLFPCAARCCSLSSVMSFLKNAMAFCWTTGRKYIYFTFLRLHTQLLHFVRIWCTEFCSICCFLMLHYYYYYYYYYYYCCCCCCCG